MLMQAISAHIGLTEIPKPLSNQPLFRHVEARMSLLKFWQKIVLIGNI